MVCFFSDIVLKNWEDTEDDLTGTMALTLVTLLSVNEPTENGLWDKIKCSRHSDYCSRCLFNMAGNTVIICC